jgi:hypothetical protein
VDEKDLIKIGMVVAKATVVYALPALLATWWRQRNPERIAALNLLLGWTGIGWLALLGHVVWRRWRGSRSPRWRRRPRGTARTVQVRADRATAAELRADLEGSASLR